MLTPAERAIMVELLRRGSVQTRDPNQSLPGLTVTTPAVHPVGGVDPRTGQPVPPSPRQPAVTKGAAR